MGLDSKQKAVIRWAIPAVAITLVALVALLVWIPNRALPVDETGARLAWALPWTLLPMLTLMVSIMRVANHRFATPEDIDGSGLTTGTARVLVLRAILQNTLEQAILAVMAYLVWSVTMPVPWLGVIPVAAVLFTIGRVLFAGGYERGAAGRAMGFGLTAYATFGMLITLAAALGLRLLGRLLD
jgi:hypothetical protein